MKTVFLDIETLPDDGKLELATRRITKDYERQGKEVTDSDIDRYMGTIPQWCTIAGIGIAINDGVIRSLWLGDDTSDGRKAEEKDLLNVFWWAIESAHHIVTYNGGYFDLNVIKWRTAALGLPVSRPLYDLKPWDMFHIDVFRGLFPHGAKFMFLQNEVLENIGLEIPEDFHPILDIDGSQVRHLFAAGEIEKLRLYNSFDVWATREIAKWGGGVYWPNVVVS